MNGADITKTRGMFLLGCRAEIGIRAEAERIWDLLTDAKNYPNWNSMVLGIDGTIREGQRLRIRVPGTGRTFSPIVRDLVPNRRMKWVGGVPGVFRGVRTFELGPRVDGSTVFMMEERFTGLMLLFVKSSMPDFGPVFGQWASNLKEAAERN
ncbi:MAG TPA: SRPBCC domain-containing protein [Thermoanaerobaculia bacterium]|nr:SRPBCC domain-containing protein [Thermoanaerobaculia bacterium]